MTDKERNTLIKNKGYKFETDKEESFYIKGIKDCEDHLLYNFKESIRILRDLADLQNGPPLERYKEQWHQTMNEVYQFLHENENILKNES